MAVVARLVIVISLCACAYAQYAEDRQARYIPSGSEQKVAPTPVPILKQINKHNEDGSYTYGYEAADGSFKIETKAANGEVKGKYGYKDDTGKTRVIEYGADKFGFQPAGEGITVAPPTLVDETTGKDGLAKNSQGGRYQSAPAQQIDYDYEEPAPRPAPRPRPQSLQHAYRAPSVGPAPPRPAIVPGAAPVSAPAPLDQNTFFNPEPPKVRAPKPRPAPAQQYQALSQPGFSNDYTHAEPKQYNQVQQNFASQQPQYQQSQPQYSQQTQYAPQPQYSPQQPQYSPQPQFPQAQQRSAPYSMLDQLLKEFSLPANGAAPLHDITFGTNY